jgi:hypothetical protein
MLFKNSKSAVICLLRVHGLWAWAMYGFINSVVSIFQEQKENIYFCLRVRLCFKILLHFSFPWIRLLFILGETVHIFFLWRRPTMILWPELQSPVHVIGLSLSKTQGYVFKLKFYKKKKKKTYIFFILR